MKKYSYLVIIFAAIISCSCAKQSNVESGNLKLWYQQPAENWLEALPLGNGRLGAMVYGKPSVEHLQLNEESLWAGCPEDPYPENVREHYEKFQELNLAGKYEEAQNYALKNLAVSPTSIRSYEPLGSLYIDFGHKDVQNYQRDLNLHHGIATVEYEIDGKRFIRESFISSKYNAIFYHFSGRETVNSNIRFEREKDIRKYINNKNVLCIDGQIFDDEEGYDDNPGGSGKGGYHMKFAARIAIQPQNGEVVTKEDHLIINNTNDFTVIVSAATDYNLDSMNFDRSIDPGTISDNTLNDALNVPYKQIKEEHIRAHSEMFDRVSLNIGNEVADTIPTDVRLQNLRSGSTDSHLAILFFQYGRYLLISGSTRPGVLPLNLQGIWNEDIWAAWESDYHLNINLQMNYWPADVCNLPETLEPLSNFICLLSEKGKTTAKNFIGSDGWIAHHSTNSFGRTTPCGSTKHSQVFNGYSFPMAGAWMSLSLWRHYEFTEDKEYLKNQVYPVIKGAAEFILDFLKENENEELVTAPSYSPENMYIDPATGERMLSCVAASIDIQIIKDIFNACLASEKILSKKRLTHKIQAAMAKLPDVKIGADGTIQEWYEDFEEVEPGHRHISHLFALYPSNQITKDTPKLFEAAEKTIEKRLSTGGGQTGWSRAWIINFYARLYNGDESLKHLDMLLQNQVSPNLFDMHPALAAGIHGLFQIDGNLGATSGVAEMLLQSHNGEIHLLPALPGTWSVGKVKGLRARGGFEVSMEWNNGELISAKVKSINGNNCILKYKKTQVEISFEKEEEVVFNNQLDIIGETKLRTID